MGTFAGMVWLAVWAACAVVWGLGGLLVGWFAGLAVAAACYAVGSIVTARD